MSFDGATYSENNSMEVHVVQPKSTKMLALHRSGVVESSEETKDDQNRRLQHRPYGLIG